MNPVDSNNAGNHQNDVCRSVVAYFSADFGLESNYDGGHLKEL